jgi:hypothetical protein
MEWKSTSRRGAGRGKGSSDWRRGDRSDVRGVGMLVNGIGNSKMPSTASSTKPTQIQGPLPASMIRTK